VNPSTIVFTIVSGNYLHFARTLMESVAVAHPDWRRFVLLVDAKVGNGDSGNALFELVPVATLPLPDRLKFYFRYTILELNTAVKPWMFEWLFRQQGGERVVYLDPDIYVYRPLAEVEAALGSGSTMVLTPHLTGPLDDEHHPNELDIVMAGAYNLGFLALAKHESTLDFLAWWQSKLEFHCVVDHAKGTFVDQKWLDLAPGMFENVTILRHEGYNVAYWNLAHREVAKAGNEYLVNGRPLVFYHFSGLNPKSPEGLSKHQDRFRLSRLDAVRALADAYIERLRKNGADAASQYRYAFGYFTNGQPIPDSIRELYRQDDDFQRSAGENPFELDVAYLNRPLDSAEEGACPITVVMRHVWNKRPDVQQAYPKIFTEDRLAFAQWFVRTGAHESGIPEACISPVASALRPPVQPTPVPSQVALADSAAPSSLDELLTLSDRDFVMEAYRTVLRRPPDAGGFQHFLSALHAGASRVDVIWRLRYSREGRRGRTQLRGLLLQYAGDRLRRLWARPVRRPALPLQIAPAARASQGPAGSSGRSSGPADSSGERWADLARRRFGRADYAGFYDSADEQAGPVWMGKSASVRLRDYRSGASLRVIGSYDAGYQRQANGSAETTIDILLNDERIGGFVLARSGDFDVSVDLPIEVPSTPVYVTLLAATTFSPAKIGLNADSRDLSMRIARIEVNGRPVLDFARSGSPYVTATAASAAPGVNIVGYIRSETGVGESARLCAGSARAIGLPFVLCDFNAGNSARAQDLSWRDSIATNNPYPVNVFHINADQMTLARETLGAEFFHDRYNIGFWHWELPEFPARFLSGFAFLDEIWVPSHFVMDAVSAKSPIPVVRMPHAVDFEVDPAVRRARFGLPDDAFLFLAMYDMHSAQGRKNPHAVIAAYRKAFPDPKRVGLVLKVQNTHSHREEFEQLMQELSDYPGIVVIDRTLSRTEVYELESVCDSFISLHRSEGFGLGLAESMYLGKPVIGTNWSGNVDFMTARNSCPVNYELVELERDFGPYYRKGNTWAEPDIEHAASYMARLVDDAPWRRRIALEGQRTIRTDFAPRRVGTLYRNRLKQLLAAGAISSRAAIAAQGSPVDASMESTG